MSAIEKDWRDELTEVQKSQILAGLKDAESGNVISSELFWEKLKTPPNVKKAFKKGMKDIKEGRYLTNKEANAEMDKWLRK